MENLEKVEKVEKLRERADVTYEEAKEALETNNWDLLDAMVSLEKQGKTIAPEQAVHSTSYEEQVQYEPVKETVYEGQTKEKEGLKGILRRFFDICRNNSFLVKKNEDVIIRLPVLLLILILFFTWRIALPLLIIGLFFSFRYSFEGRDDLSQANDLMDSAGNAADRVREEFRK